MLRAIVFDFDGVIVDSEPLHYRALLEVAQGFGHRFDYAYYLKEYVGFDDRDAFRAMLLAAGHEPADARIRSLCGDKQSVFDRIVKEGPVPIPGAIELIDEAVAAGLPIAISSGATRRDIDEMLASLGKRGRFEVIVSADDVAHSKPDPACYTLAVKRLAARFRGPGAGIRPGDCLAIEDTAAGIASARGAGLMTLGLTTTGRADAIAHAERVIPNLAGVNLDQLRRWYNNGT